MTLKTSEKARKNLEECLLVVKKSKEYSVPESNGKVFGEGGSNQWY